ncbi:hypothetical protein B0T36_20690 [Nocardia donostiensis]|uniref:CPBP family intramembrane glutamic endopeptidase n=1 Tax=Nocardia donostiensis TaxID=1538463 RepID=UPI0009DAE8C9|nr:CPBP family intramembrane glutamic endopeptidase [Nocardia donostiensis]OQS13236.1 hypothetical protein B0T36_20690 [Nocardia donostiensis]
MPFLVVGAIAGSIPGLPNELPSSAFMFVCPAVAAYLVAGRSGRRALTRWALRMGTPDAMPWIAVALMLVPALLLLAYTLLWLGGAHTHADPPWRMLPVFLVVFLIAALAEEIGWTGYVLGPLRHRLDATTAGLLLGLVWAVWHLIPLLQAGRTVAWIGGWFVSTVALRVLIVSVYEASGGLALTATTVHATSNVGSSLFPATPLRRRCGWWAW